jgi:hypothetical protein
MDGKLMIGGLGFKVDFDGREKRGFGRLMCVLNTENTWPGFRMGIATVVSG